MAKRARETFECPNCGAPVRVGSRACPECGSDDQTGWSKDTMYDALDLPDPGYGKDDQEGHEGHAHAEKGPNSIVAFVLTLLVLGATAWVITRSLSRR